MKKIDQQKLLQKIDFEPHAGQIPIIESEERETVVCAGRRFGKSAVCGYIVLRELLQPNKRIWIVAPTYDLTKKVFDYVVQFLAKAAPSQLNNVKAKPYPSIITDWGSKLECKSAENPTSLLGEELDLIVIDEAAMISKGIYETYLFPTTSSRQGRIVFISTPRGENWFWDRFIDCKKTESSFQFESRVNPTFKPEEWERAKRMMPQLSFDQEYRAIFLQDSASVFRGINGIIDECLSDVKNGHNYILGVDLGKANDFTVMTVVDTYNNSVVYRDRFNEIDWNLQKARIKSIHERYNRARVIIDSTGLGSPVADDLQRSGVFVDDFVLSGKTKNFLIEKLSIFIEQKEITIPSIDSLIDELRQYGYEFGVNGKMIYNAPEGKHDDCVISLALAVWGLNGKINPMTALEKRIQESRKKRNNKNYI